MPDEEEPKFVKVPDAGVFVVQTIDARAALMHAVCADSVCSDETVEPGVVVEVSGYHRVGDGWIKGGLRLLLALPATLPLVAGVSEAATQAYEWRNEDVPRD